MFKRNKSFQLIIHSSKNKKINVAIMSVIPETGKYDHG